MIRTNAYVNTTQDLLRNGKIRVRSGDTKYISTSSFGIGTNWSPPNLLAHTLNRSVVLLPQSQQSEIKLEGKFATEGQLQPKELLDDLILAIAYGKRYACLVDIDSLTVRTRTNSLNVFDRPTSDINDFESMPMATLMHMSEAAMNNNIAVEKVLQWAWVKKVNLLLVEGDEHVTLYKHNDTRELFAFWYDDLHLHTFLLTTEELETLLPGGSYSSVAACKSIDADGAGAWLTTVMSCDGRVYERSPLFVHMNYDYKTNTQSTRIVNLCDDVDIDSVHNIMSEGSEWYKNDHESIPQTYSRLLDIIPPERALTPDADTVLANVVFRDDIKAETLMPKVRRIMHDRRVRGTKVWLLRGAISNEVSATPNGVNIPWDLCLPKRYRYLACVELTQIIVNGGECTLVVIGMFNRATQQLSNLCIIPVYPTKIDQRQLTKFIYSVTREDECLPLVFLEALGPCNYAVDILDLLEASLIEHHEHSIRDGITSAVNEMLRRFERHDPHLISRLCDMNDRISSDDFGEMRALHMIVDMTEVEKMQLLSIMLSNTYQQSFMSADIGHLIYLSVRTKTTEYVWYFGIPAWLRTSMTRRVLTTSRKSISNRTQCERRSGIIYSAYDMLVLPCGAVTYHTDPLLHWHDCTNSDTE